MSRIPLYLYIPSPVTRFPAPLHYQCPQLYTSKVLACLLGCRLDSQSSSHDNTLYLLAITSRSHVPRVITISPPSLPCRFPCTHTSNLAWYNCEDLI
ncbi:hypothetical protein BD289DRAFT_423490, partial [Coniella lustricola]